ncbi:hypothetical protein NDN08_004520 [Rhodosorus marinus]|uniref:Phytanoyl-CoA dioxygenase n=1 Tax=Rhodosorus marinus TaxID=101924 RepID=A0AAV8UQM5_9RHOD|nr:hypothetical protein NDN08_004520 [Rhodosorus marinus]
MKEKNRDDDEEREKMVAYVEGKIKWFKEKNPDLHIGDKQYSERTLEVVPGAEPSQDYVSRLEEEGFFSVDRVLEDNELINRLARGAQRLAEYNMPPTFLILYDEVWMLVKALTKLVQSSAAPENEFNGDVLVWVIDPNKDDAGFTPHRDRQPEDVELSFAYGKGFNFARVSPQYHTCWVALTDATPDNSCLYVIPKHADPGYMTGDLDTEDPLQRALKKKDDYQSIRAVPLQAGGAAIFSHRIIHWGSRGRKGPDVRPRISISFAYSKPSFEPNYLLRLQSPSKTFPEVLDRLHLASAQVIAYHDRFQPTIPALRDSYKIFKYFKTRYRHQYRKRLPPEDATEAEGNARDGSSGEDLIEAMVEEMLESEYLIQDDFDKMAAEEAGGDPPDEGDASDRLEATLEDLHDAIEKSTYEEDQEVQSSLISLRDAIRRSKHRRNN